VSNTVTLNELANSPPQQALMALRFALFRDGPLSTAGPVATVFTRSDPSHETPNIQIQILPLTYAGFNKPPSPHPGFSAGTCNLRPSSRGSVHADDPDTRVAPKIRYNLLSTPDDQQVVIDSLKIVRRIVTQPAMARFGPREMTPGPAILTDEALLENARETMATVYHPAGTCMMGVNAMAVVDNRLRVHGIKGLRVADASIMPNLVSGNTNAPTIMIGEKAAAMMQEDRKAFA
jgi:choline dehydrogenase-like flavoprotein